MRNVDLKIIPLSFLFAYTAYLLPWAGFGLMLRPDFVLLVTIYWLLRAPQYCNVGTAWLLGLLIDVSSGSLFGQNALAYTVTARGRLVEPAGHVSCPRTSAAASPRRRRRRA